MGHEQLPPSDPGGDFSHSGDIELSQLSRWRAECADLSPQSFATILQSPDEYILPVTDLIFSRAQEQQSFYAAEAHRYSETTALLPGDPAIYRRVSVAGVRDTANRIQAIAIHSHLEGEREEFAYWYDVIQGIRTVVNGIWLADTNDTVFTLTLRQSVDQAQEFDLIPSAVTKAASAIREKEQAEAKQLLEKDATGFAAVDARIATFQAIAQGQPITPETAPYMLPYQIPAVVYSGAFIGGQLYKFVYHLSKETPPETPTT